MPQYCCAPLCKQKGVTDDLGDKVSFFSFPSDPVVRKKWVIAIKRDEGKLFQITKYTRLCSKHFQQSDYLANYAGSRRFLRQNAVPSIFAFNTAARPPRREPRRRLPLPPKQELSTAAAEGSANDDVADLDATCDSIADAESVANAEDTGSSITDADIVTTENERSASIADVSSVTNEEDTGNSIADADIVTNENATSSSIADESSVANEEDTGNSIADTDSDDRLQVCQFRRGRRPGPRVSGHGQTPPKKPSTYQAETLPHSRFRLLTLMEQQVGPVAPKQGGPPPRDWNDGLALHLEKSHWHEPAGQPEVVPESTGESVCSQRYLGHPASPQVVSGPERGLPSPQERTE
ncbi:uncharacterized protein ISCGN_024701 [Ixodes scapularis]